MESEEDKFRNFRISIERLTKVFFFKYEHYDIEISIDVYHDIASLYPKLEHKPDYQEYLKDKLDWLNRHKKIDDYHKSQLIKIYNKYVNYEKI